MESLDRESLLSEKSKSGRKGYSLPKLDVPRYPTDEIIPKSYLRKSPVGLPEISENEVQRHFVRISTKNYHIDKNMYPLGSCTMKYNPKINEKAASLSGTFNIHPLAPDVASQGALQIQYELKEMLREIGGMHDVSLQPAAGSQGELTGIMLFKKYHEEMGNHHKKYILIPDSAHGTNPASVTISGYEVINIKSNTDGLTDMEHLKSKLNDEVAGMMLTNPSTLGLFESQIMEIQKLIHDVGGLMYMDGANLNALLGLSRPGDMGFDVVHFNLHKTFSTPHGGGGPGSGPIGVSDKVSPYLPRPEVKFDGKNYYQDYSNSDSIGKVHSYYGSFGMMVRAWVYIRMHGAKGLKRISENAILNANYILHRLKDYYDLPFEGPVMHEVIFSGNRQKKQNGVKTLDIAKRILDYGYHAPTIYFPLIVPECIMIEPTESEAKENIDGFCDAMIALAEEAKSNPEIVKTAPHNAGTKRLDDAYAAKNINVRWKNRYDAVKESELA
ncbi:MAG: aminomethyl-transferring glycine dehydrogenase subunit GcvPB [Balneolales bacterium]